MGKLFKEFQTLIWAASLGIGAIIYTCFHVFFLTKQDMLVLFTPYILAISACFFILAETISLIIITSATLNTLKCCSSPFMCLSFLTMSWEFCFGVPINKCTGFTHKVTSQLWHTKNPFGIGPFFIVQDTLWAVEAFIDECLNLPYLPSENAFHIQQLPSDSLYGCIGPFLSTFSKKFFSIDSGLFPSLPIRTQLS